jgi:hypothetical protein
VECCINFLGTGAAAAAAAPAAGDDVLNWLSFGHTSIPKTLGSEARILAFYYWLTYCILKAGKPRFEAVQAPAAAATGAVTAAAKPKAIEAAAVQQNGAAAAVAEKQQEGAAAALPVLA